MDLAPALVEEDLGPQLAIRVAREMVLDLKRPGGQSQFSAALTLQASDRHPISDLQAWILEHLSDDLSVDRLAHRCDMSPRNFARLFVTHAGITPSKFVERRFRERVVPGGAEGTVRGDHVVGPRDGVLRVDAPATRDYSGLGNRTVLPALGHVKRKRTSIRLEHWPPQRPPGAW